MLKDKNWHPGLLSLPQKKIEITKTKLCNTPTKVLPEKSMNLREKIHHKDKDRTRPSGV